MAQRKTHLVTAVLIAGSVAGLTACGGGGGGSSTSSNNTSSAASFQQDLVDNGQIQFTAADPQLDSSTFAGTASAVTAAMSYGYSNFTTAQQAFFDDTGYRGAVDPNASAGSAWWNGWTLHMTGADTTGADGSLKDQDINPLKDNLDGSGTQIAPAGNGTCPAGSQTGTVDYYGTTTMPVCEISVAGLDADGDLDTAAGNNGGSVTLDNGHVYVLNGLANFGNGGVSGRTQTSAQNYTLTIEKGTMIYGAEGQKAGLVITRGSDIQVNGTQDMPVMMGAAPYSGSGLASADAEDFSGRGDWGGLIIDGFAKVNAADQNGEVVSEAAPDGVSRYFGGNDDTDSSGNLSYLIVAESGTTYRPDEEIQGITWEGVGSGTTADHLQIIGSEDDGTEFFGGMPHIKYILVNGQDDDGLDQDLGFRGWIQYAIVRTGTANGNRSMETDGNGDNFDATPYSEPILMNVTLLGNEGKTSVDSTGALHREGYRGHIYRSIITDDTVAGGAYRNGCLDVDDAKPSELQYRDVIFNCSPDNLHAPDD